VEHTGSQSGVSFSQQEGIAEGLKAADQMEWMRKIRKL
jgi:hypothetical protein